MTSHEQLKQQAKVLKLYGLLAHWQELTEEQRRWLCQWLARESAERKQRGVERRLRSARIGRFKLLPSTGAGLRKLIRPPSMN